MLLLASGAWAHPMGTASTNRSAIAVVVPGQAWIDYTVDFAELPSVAEARRLDELGPERYAADRMAELQPGVHLRVDGVERELRAEGCEASTGAGEGGLPVVTLDCRLRTDPIDRGVLEVRDDNFAGLVGWREIRLVGDGVPLGGAVPAEAVVNGPPPLPFHDDPARMTLASARATVGVEGAAGSSTPERAPVAQDPLSGLVTGDLSPRVAALAVLSAVGLGAGHALSPGHGKALVGAYLVGARGTVRQAVLLGLVVTATHVSSVLLLGMAMLLLSRYVVTAELFPVLGVASGLGVVAIGLGLLRSRLEAPHDDVVRGPDGEPVALGRLLALGVTGGAVPCPSALVVLLAAIALHRIAFGLGLIVAFSVGLASVLVGIGILVVRARGWLDRLAVVGRAGRWVPVASAAVVIGLGLLIVAQSAREGGW
jgi:ABC-type nickel/cobalt efflux system permease component RcnA